MVIKTLFNQQKPPSETFVQKLRELGGLGGLGAFANGTSIKKPSEIVNFSRAECQIDNKFK